MIFFSILSYSQITNFEEVEKFVKEVPKSETTDIETLTKYLKKNAKNKKEIVSRIYFWMPYFQPSRGQTARLQHE